MTQSILWLSSEPPTAGGLLEEQLRSEGYTVFYPDSLLPEWEWPTARSALIEWTEDGKTAGQQVHFLRRHQPACCSLLLLPKARSAVLAGVLLTVTGYLAAPLCAAELVACLHRIGLGEGYWNADLLALLTGTLQGVYPAGLSRREHELLDHLANGLTNPQIQTNMILSNSRVKNLKTGLAQKLDLPNAQHLTEWAVAWRKASL